VFHNPKTAGSRNTQHSHVVLKVQDVLNIIDCTKVNIINNLHSVVKQTTRQICSCSKQNKRNHVLMYLNILIAKRTIKQIPISIPSENITSIGSGMLQNTRKPETIGPNKPA